MDTMIHEKCLLSKYVMIRSVHYWPMRANSGFSGRLNFAIKDVDSVIQFSRSVHDHVWHHHG